MRTRIGVMVAALSLSCAGACLSSATAQQAPDAATVAAQVQAFYDQTRTVQADFYQTYVNKLYQRTDRSRGRVIFAKPGKMRWDYAGPNGKVIVSNGSRIVVYEPAAHQYFEQQLGDSQLPSALSFLTGIGRIADDFSFRMLDSRAHGFPSGYVLDLRPQQPSPHYDRVLFYVDGSAARPGLVHRVLIIDHSGNRNRFDFTYRAGAFNGVVSDTSFRWTPPRGTRRIQP